MSALTVKGVRIVLQATLALGIPEDKGHYHLLYFGCGEESYDTSSRLCGELNHSMKQSPSL
jgi:hypothetical protein